MKNVLLVAFSLLVTLAANAQDEYEYKMEIGVGAGLVSYQGDFNGSIVKNMQPSASLMLHDNPVEFSNTLMDLGLTFEYNFWPYGTGREYRGAKRITPFVFMGIGATYADTDAGSAFTANVPIGAGVKYKLGKRLNLGLEWAMHFSLSDKLDGVEDPYGIESTGMFKNTDCYSMLKLTLTYSFMPKCKICNKDD